MYDIYIIYVKYTLLCIHIHYMYKNTLYIILIFQQFRSRSGSISRSELFESKL